MVDLVENSFEFGNYLIFADESGEHSLKNIDSNFPIFNLTFVMFEKEYYCDVVLPKFNKIKLKYFRDNNVVFHEREIRKRLDKFAILNDPKIRDSFMNDLNDFFNELNFHIITVNVLKKTKKEKIDSMYSICVNACMKFIYEHLRFDYDKDIKKTTLTFESREKKEDNDLELAFLKEAKEKEYNNLSIDFVSKKSNQAGLQIADLVARPIANWVLQMDKNNEFVDDTISINCKNLNGEENLLDSFSEFDNRAVEVISKNICTLLVVNITSGPIEVISSLKLTEMHPFKKAKGDGKPSPK